MIEIEKLVFYKLSTKAEKPKEKQIIFSVFARIVILGLVLGVSISVIKNLSSYKTNQVIIKTSEDTK